MAFRRSGVRFPSAPLVRDLLEIRGQARVAELVDAQDSGSCGGNPVRVRVPPRALLFIKQHGCPPQDADRFQDRFGLGIFGSD